MISLFPVIFSPRPAFFCEPFPHITEDISRPRFYWLPNICYVHVPQSLASEASVEHTEDVK